MRVETEIQRWPLKGTFTISRGSKTEAEVVVATITDANGQRGHAECVPYPRYGESSASVVAEIEKFAAEHGAGLCHDGIASNLKAGAARNALDCALWDLRAKQNKKRVWELVEIPPPSAATTAYTLSLDTADNMAQQAKIHRDRPLLKIKLGPEGAVERIQAIRAQAGNAKLIVDANEAWSLGELDNALAALVAAEVVLIEQPLPADQDADLAGFNSPIPIAADESCHVTEDIEQLVGRYQAVNIKLDKAGGLTESLRLERTARERGLQIMIGCMIGTSLAMAPATLLTHSASVVDLDGPLWLGRDRTPGLEYVDHRIGPPRAALWG